MRSLSILLLYKNTQGVNSHGLVGELLPVSTVNKSGLMPSAGFIRKDLEDNKWYCLFETSSESANVVKVQSISYVNQIPVDATIRYCIYRGIHSFRYKINGSTSDEYKTKMKYKLYGNERYKVWIKSGYVSLQFTNNKGFTNVLVLNEPDSDALDMNGEE